MAFTVEDFPDLLRLLAEHPEWRAPLRQQVLSEDLLELPAIVRDLAEAQRLTETRVAQLAEAQARTAQRLDTLTARVDALAAQVEALAARVDALTARVEALAARVDALADQV